jgi:hypothetical protein
MKSRTNAAMLKISSGHLGIILVASSAARYRLVSTSVGRRAGRQHGLQVRSGVPPAWFSGDQGSIVVPAGSFLGILLGGHSSTHIAIIYLPQYWPSPMAIALPTFGSTPGFGVDSHQASNVDCMAVGVVSQPPNHKQLTGAECRGWASTFHHERQRDLVFSARRR